MTEQTSSQALAESLSALMDNQASELELMRLLKAAGSDAELKSTWARYQLASASLRQDLPTLADMDFASRVSAALVDEPAHSSAVNQAAAAQSLPWWQQLGRVAVAASVAGAVILGVQQYQQTQLPEAGIAGTNTPATPVVNTPAVNPPDLPSGINAPALSARTVAVQSGYENRPQESRRVMFVPRQEAAPIYNEDVSVYVNQLIEEHSGNAALNSGQGMLPFTRVILTEEE
ncbi:sigma-E factor negative regulatory protein [Cellvibrio japonicus]|uniref:MucA n=1 Tax=Cellvibrio japonicus (strain Ueda107) TaxID=498211 RepID=B3PJA0_CELJU|nr:sigma-E factor negative regulatory protein [Cellvibrio japonicus]ACE85554.1 mucA [Cellvibrio japonicus Ueda107]QEI12651.1 sigma-E factor negative regulatory protein [Cellvibrio japonicus]QEI16225.1 sigma-E factor negative regulatory protein [Cellvibrio japonicus]QEI19803.1 sigma-E factor negative regulatory protein [Cellvibrio japonicus]